MTVPALQARVDRLVSAYRLRGHLAAKLDPLGRRRDTEAPELDPGFYGLGDEHMDTEFASESLPGPDRRSLRDIIAFMRETYCGAVAVELAHIDEAGARAWLLRRMEKTRNRTELDEDHQRRILRRLTHAVVFEQFVRKKFTGAKSFSLEGAETLLPLLDLTFEQAANHGVDEVVMGMTHRGRLNVLANVMGVAPEQMFLGLEDRDPPPYGGDVRYHLGHSTDIETVQGQRVHVSLCFNPSHLEFVSPVVVGRTRAKQDRRGDLDRRQVMALIIHGDAAFAGEGVVQETLNLSELRHYAVGGAVHVIVNNQLGFTTPPAEGRSSRYATGVAKLLGIPIIHVNGEDPAAVAQAVQLGMAFRRAFSTDIVIDMYCFRRQGHNEMDDPTFTQPRMYDAVERHGGIRAHYLARLLRGGHLSREEADDLWHQCRVRLGDALDRVRNGDARRTREERTGVWANYCGGRASQADTADTTRPIEDVRRLLVAQTEVPDGFEPHRRFDKFFERRRAMAEGKRPLDWSAAESLALATLATEGVPTRMSGQDTVRGTFGQRHARLHDMRGTATHFPLRHLSPDQARVDIGNSPLSEVAALAFEYGYSLDAPQCLTVWEAQYGDFANAAQVVIDQFLVAAETKWNRLTGLVLLLPHGLEGQGPEHSSARIERFLHLVADDNLQVASPSTPAQYYHLLRRQALRRWRKPLVCMTPKSLLRHPRCTSTMEELAGGAFEPVIADPDVRRRRPHRVLLCSGKVYYDLVDQREEHGIDDVPIVRLEQLAPLPVDRLYEVFGSYEPTTSVLWVQEEPSNMGPWRYLRAQLARTELSRFGVLPVSRPASSSPAVGSGSIHRKEQRELCNRALGVEPESEDGTSHAD